MAAGFTRRYYLKRLVYFERYDDIATAIQRETNIKRWPREWKIKLALMALVVEIGYYRRR